jgi:hypothetical protein
MSGQARITSFDALREARSAVQRFIEEAAAALGEAEGDAQRTLAWLRFEQVGYWQGQVRQRHEAVEMAKAELRRKELTSIQESPSAVEERRAIDRARAREAEAHAKVQQVRRWLVQLEREHTLFKGSAQSLADMLARDLPAAIVRLDRMASSVEAYAAMNSGAVLGAGAAGVPLAGPVVAAVDEETARRYASLRRRAPGPAARAATAASSPDFVARDERIEEPLGGLYSSLGLKPEALPPSDKVMVEADALESAMIVLARGREVVPGDSGWFIGSALPGVAPGAMAAVTVAELGAHRPGLMELLGLPRGYLVVVVGAGGGAKGRRRGDGESGNTSEGAGTGETGGAGASIEAVLDPDDRLVIGGTGS